MTRIGIVGRTGRMGQAIAALVEDEEDFVLAGGVERDGDLAALASSCDVLIDFSAPAALPANLDAAAAAVRPIVIGTTGLEVSHHAAIDAAARTVAVLQSANMSLGVNLLAHLVGEAAARLGEDWDIEIAEMHHRHKADAPSGTALMLGDAAAQARKQQLADVAARGRDGMTGPRATGSIGFAALRGGSVAGDHRVIFASEGERLELSHVAESREIFARGALRAAVWLAGQPPGRYAMAHLLGLK
ncbi:MAG: 4-hydroxy-tetrahydrodipicolinate reductase [Sphingosinicella sp.]